MGWSAARELVNLETEARGETGLSAAAGSVFGCPGRPGWLGVRDSGSHSVRLLAGEPARAHSPSTNSVNEISYVLLMPVDFKQPSWEAAKYPGRHVAPVGAQAGARELAASVYELDPGAVGSPLHIHHANEELLLVLDGTLSLRGPDGTQLLPAGAVVAFARGKAGAHSLVNHSDAPVRYLVVSTTNCPDVVEYPDTGAMLVVLAEQRLAYPDGADAHQTPVIAEAIQAAANRDA